MQPHACDLIVGYQGRYYELEVKLPGEHATARQRWRLEKVQRAGCVRATVHSAEEALAVVQPPHPS